MVKKVSKQDKKEMIGEYDKIILDFSVIIEGIVSKWLDEGVLSSAEIIIHDKTIQKLEAFARENKTTGVLGLEELEKISEFCKKKNLEFRIVGSHEKLFRDENLDKISREIAYDEDATLMTADNTNAEICRVKGIKYFLVNIEDEETLLLEKFFDETTMSVHLKEKVESYAKKGFPGSWEFVKINDDLLTAHEIQLISKQILEQASIRDDGFIEIEREGSTIIQLGKFRIVITRPPFSDGWEITAVRPVKRLNLEEYELSEKLMDRIKEQAEGILVAGSPGMGKSTFAQSLAEFYSEEGKVVKTIEAPRDLILKDNITQYAISHGSSQEIHDILLLSRPDITLFDEMRNTEDFSLFADMRLSGIGMCGVIHATNPVDAISRFLGRIELGVIPQVIDTVVFIKEGGVNKVLSIEMTVKVPSGMTESDLARPVVLVRDFEDGKSLFEIYSYGEQTVVIPVKAGEETKSGMKSLAEKEIKRFFRKYSDLIDVEVTSDHGCTIYVPQDYVGEIIGKKGKKIMEIEERLGISIDVKEKESEAKQLGREVEYQFGTAGKSLVFYLSPSLSNKIIDIFVGDDFLLSSNVSKKGEIRIKKDNKMGKVILNCMRNNEDVVLREG